MPDSPEVSVLIHELGGMLSSVQGFAHIAEANPEHPDRERFIKLAASESRRAAQTVKDIHLIRSFDRGGVSAAPPPVTLAGLMEAVRAQHPDAVVEPVAGSEDTAVSVDPAKVASLLARCLAAATVPASMRVVPDGVAIAIALAPADELTRRTQALDAPYPDMIVFSLTRRLLRHWGGDLTLAAEGEWAVATILLPRA
jgi:signal transduction histidine kinase